jgi:glutaredoxin
MPASLPEVYMNKTKAEAPVRTGNDSAAMSEAAAADESGGEKEIIYYKSRICPKCIPTSRFLKKLKEDYPEITIREVEVFFHMKSAREAKIHSIPVIEAAGKRFYKVPSRKEILSLIAVRE